MEKDENIISADISETNRYLTYTKPGKQFL